MEIGIPIRDRFHLPAAALNDANAFVLAEARVGAAAGRDPVVGLTLGTGVGGGLIVSGRLLTGARGFAGEIGHMVLDPGGPQCACGQRGCLEALASRSAIERDIRAAIAAGRSSAVTDLLEQEHDLFKSKVLRKALEASSRSVPGAIPP